MGRRVSKSLVALAFALVLALSTPVASAATRSGGFDPSFGNRIVKILKQYAKRFFLISSQDDIRPGPPIP